MVRREGTRFGVSTGHSVRRSTRSQENIHAAQNIVVKAWTDVKLRRAHKQASDLVETHLQNRTLNVKGLDKEMVLPFSLNKSKRWEVVNTLKKEVDHSLCHGNHFVITEHHIGVGRPGDDDCCIAVYDSMSERAKSSPHKTYAKARDLITKEPHPSVEDLMLEDEEFGMKNRRRRQRKKVQVDKKTGVQVDAFTVNVSYDINLAAPRKTCYTFPKRAATSSYDENDEDVVLQSTKRGTKKRNRKPARHLWDDVHSLEAWDDEEDYDDDYGLHSQTEEHSKGSVIQSVASKSEGTNVLGMYLVTEAYQLSKSSTKRKSSPNQGSLTGTKERVFEIEEPLKNEGKVRRENEFEKESNVPLNHLVSGGSLLQEVLQGQFGDKYQEAHCSPRRFAVSITRDIYENLKKRGHAHKCDALLSSGYQVFAVFCPPPMPSLKGMEEVTVKVVGEKFNDMDVTKIIINLYPEAKTVSGLVENIATCLSDRADDRHFCELTTHLSKGKVVNGISLETIEGSLKFGCEIHTRQQLAEQLLKQPDIDCGERKTGTSAPVPWSSSGGDACCGICYSELCDACPGTCLLACNHWFCDECWKGYLVAKVLQGILHINCPEFNCDSPVDPVTLMSLVPSKISSFHWQQKISSMVALDKHLHWCPITDCTRVAKLSGALPNMASSGGLSIICDCGSFWCSKCKQDAHWPATCNQADTYRKERSIVLKSIMAEANEVFVDMVRYKCCPRCTNPIEKVSGCNWMNCPCKCVFCWYCLEEFDPGTHHDHHNNLKGGPVDHEIFEFEQSVQSLDHAYEVAVKHHFRGLKSSCVRRQFNAVQLANMLAVAIYREKGTEENKAASFALLNARKEGQRFLEDTKAMFKKSSDFIQEADFVLEFVEILLVCSPPSELKRTVFQQKSTLAFIAQQLDEILNRRVDVDKSHCGVERVHKLYQNGKICLSWLAKGAAELNRLAIMGNSEEQGA